MKRYSGSVLAAAVLAAATCIGTAGAAIVPVTSALITGSNSDNMAGAFDAQPTSDPVAGTTSTTVGNGFGGFYGYAPDGPSIGMDFGASYATNTFTDVYLLQGTYGTPAKTINYFWSTDTKYDAGVDTAAPNINLFNYSGNGTGSSSGKWVLEYHNAAGVIPEARYLIGRPADASSEGNFNLEVAFVNNVPEPASLSLLGAVVAGSLLRRRR